MWKILGVLAVVGMLAACSGIEPGKSYPTETFTVPVTYQEAYRRAQDHARSCLSTFDVSGDLYTDNRTGVVRVQIPKFLYTGKESMQFKIAQLDSKTSRVSVVVDGVGVFDERQLIAARKTVETGTPVCR